jgi:hypothetical protein
MKAAIKKILQVTLVYGGFQMAYFTALGKAPIDSAIIGRWDITITINENKQAPSWLEVYPSGFHNLAGQFVGIIGSARPVSSIQYSNGKLIFTIPAQWESDTGNITVEGDLINDTLKGIISISSGKKYLFKAVKAPAFKSGNNAIKWGKPIQLFNGKNLNGWQPDGEKNYWKVENGILKNEKYGANLITQSLYSNFKLHIEFRYAKGGGSGVYLRGRYEVQIEDDKGLEPNKELFGGVYGFIAPSVMAAKNAGEWQSFDIILIGRMVTVIANGTTVICNREIPGITGGALDSDEHKPGPLYLQGDHGPIEFRNIILTPTIK